MFDRLRLALHRYFTNNDLARAAILAGAQERGYIHHA